MKKMFYSGSFNQPLNSWDVSSVTNMSEMFGATLNTANDFNKPINNWDVSNVIDMSGMFRHNGNFNQPLNNWDVSNVTDMSSMFSYAGSFNQQIDNWDVSNVTDMNSMFSNTYSFNQPIDNWDVSNVTDMTSMFSNTVSFNQPLNNWNVSNVTSMTAMFNDADTFNQPLNNWDVSNVLFMGKTFYDADLFNQNIADWNFNPSVTFGGDFYLSGFISYTAMDVQNFDALLVRFAQLGLQGKTFRANTLEYCNISTRNYLVVNLGWTILGTDISDNCDNFIHGNIIYDRNNDGCGGNDPFVGGFMIEANDGTNIFRTFSIDGNHSYGNYYFGGMQNASYTVSLVNMPTYYAALPTSATVAFTTSDTVQQDFCVTATQSIEDLNVTLLPTGQARPGFNADYQLVVENIGTQTVANASVTLSFDDTKQSFTSATPSPTSTTANQLTFGLANLLPFETRTIDIVMQTFTPPTVNGGDMLNFTAIVTPNTNDNTPADNTFNFAQTVVNSFDPNDKQVLQGDEISISQAGEYLDYLIRFQNTGTTSAINVRVLDTLHPKLDYSTIKPVSASHAYRVEITDGNHVEFIFENINLPHETANGPGSHGFIAYKIKPKSNVQIGDFITGNAKIYFDFNPPITTNTVSTEIVNLGVEEQLALENQIIIYPNPANDQLNIHLSNGIVLEGATIRNIQGRELISVQGNQKSIGVEGLAAGIYFIELETNRGVVNQRFVKD